MSRLHYYLSQFGSEGNLDHQLSNPYGLSVDRNGNIIVADMGNKLKKPFLPVASFCINLVKVKVVILFVTIFNMKNIL